MSQQVAERPRKLTPPQIARMWGVSVEKILAFIRAGQLRAVNGALPGRNQRPRWLVDVDDLRAFEESRSNQHQQPDASKPAPRARRRGECEGPY